jgi:hypothetical protein
MSPHCSPQIRKPVVVRMRYRSNRKAQQDLLDLNLYLVVVVTS